MHIHVFMDESICNETKEEGTEPCEILTVCILRGSEVMSFGCVG